MHIKSNPTPKQIFVDPTNSLTWELNSRLQPSASGHLVNMTFPNFRRALRNLNVGVVNYLKYL